MSNILIGVTGSISAYKSASVVSQLVDRKHRIKVIMTENAKKFICPLTLSALSHHPVYDETTEFANDGHIHHIELADWANLFVIVPGTYNTIMKILNGTADNLLTSTVVPYLALHKKFMVFPAMNTNMLWHLEHRQLYVNNLTWLMPTVEGKMACGTEGKGKLMPTYHIIQEILKELETP